MLRRLLAAWVGNWAGEWIVRLKVSLHSICTFMHPVGYFRSFLSLRFAVSERMGRCIREPTGRMDLGQVCWDILCLVWRQLLLVRLIQEGHGSE